MAISATRRFASLGEVFRDAEASRRSGIRLARRRLLGGSSGESRDFWKFGGGQEHTGAPAGGAARARAPRPGYARLAARCAAEAARACRQRAGRGAVHGALLGLGDRGLLLRPVGTGAAGVHGTGVLESGRAGVHRALSSAAMGAA